jgi:hypothetical protein
MGMEASTNGDSGEWEIIVPPLPQEQAEKTFQQWTQHQKNQGRTVRREDVRRDQISRGAGGGCVIRYLLRKSPE